MDYSGRNWRIGTAMHPAMYPEALVQNHAHSYHGATGYKGQDGAYHNHLVYSVTGSAIPVTHNTHVHRYVSYTSRNNEHYHQMYGMTGENVSVNGGNHIHEVAGFSTINKNHSHPFGLSTSKMILSQYY